MADNKNLEVMLGDPKKAVRSMVIPIFIAMAIVNVNQFVDTFWISGLGVESSEAVASISPIYGLVMCAGIGVSVGATASISFRLGRKEFDVAGRLAGSSLVLGVLSAAVMSAVLGAFLVPIIDLMGASAVMHESIMYVAPMLILSPVLILESVIGGTLRAEGAARKSTIVQISAAALNMVIDPILIYAFGMGVFGAGLSTSLSALIALFIGLSWYFRKKTVVELTRKNMRFSKESMREVLSIALPRATESLISNASDMIQRVFLIIAGGTTAVMLYNYPWKYISLVNLPASAMNTSMIPVCSAALGQNNLEKMRTGFIYTVKTGLACSVVLGAAMFIFADPLMSILTYESSMEALRPQFVWVLRMSALLVPFSALMGMGSSMLQAMKKSKLSMYYYMIWGFVKLGLYAAVCTISFEAIIYCMIAVHVFGGLCLLGLAHREYRRIALTPKTFEAVPS